MTDKPFIAVVVPYYAGHDYLETLVASVKESTVSNVGIIIVDNGPRGDRLRKNSLFEKLQDHLTLLDAPEALGFGRACNLGIKVASDLGYSFVCLLNQDAFLYPEALAQLHEGLIETAATMVGPIQVRPDTGQVSLFCARAYVPELLSDTGQVLPLDQLPQTPRPVKSTLSGACLFATTAEFTRLGPFDPLYTMYGEDNDLSERILNEKGALYLIRAAHIAHAHTNANPTPSERRKLRLWRYESSAMRRLVRGSNIFKKSIGFSIERAKGWVAFTKPAPTLKQLEVMAQRELQLLTQVYIFAPKLGWADAQYRAQRQVKLDYDSTQTISSRI